ncbi:hypothetical protein HZA87_02960 [Candidatus Uhrbacteria bacterium]|nr:hypothetical protein [Candidatus Uhrbacteria bacterium]
MQTNQAMHLVRVGIGITFLWIGVLIFRDPETWGGLLQPWAVTLLPLSLPTAMIGTAVLDVLIGLFLLVDIFTWIAALVASIHLVLVLTLVGIDATTVRDIGLLAATLALVWANKPHRPKTS